MLHIAIFRVDINQAIKDILPFENSISYRDSLDKIDSSATSIDISTNSCNDLDYNVFDISRFTALETLNIGSDCFGYVTTFEVRNMDNLKSISVANNSFTYNKMGGGRNENKSFVIEDCEKLESITIGLFSFSDFSKQFLLRNLTSLTTVTIGMYGSMSDREIFSPSYNFHCAELVIEGKRSNLVSILDLPTLVSLTFGDGAFLLFPYARIESKSFDTTLLIDIPKLTEIKFGYMALQGNEDDMNCTLVMKGNIRKKMVER